MKNIYKTLCSIALVFNVGAVDASPLAFPEAMGFGANATGGRTGTVYHVTNLNDSGTGSFRDAVSQSNRIVVFDVSGYITISTAVSVKSNITIAGQTAPGEGIGIMGGEVSCAKQSNIIMRHLRIRPGSLTASTTDDALSLYRAHNVILDHCSFEFAPWNNIDGVGDAEGYRVDDVSFQNCLIANPTGQQFGAHCESVGSNWSWYYNAFVNSHNRNPLAKTNTVFVNNICYNNEASYTTHTSTQFSHDIVNNYFIYGPTGSSNTWYQMDKNQKIYHSGNKLDSDKDGTLNGSLSTPYFYQGDPTLLSSAWSTVTTGNPIYSPETAYRICTSQTGTLPYDELDQMIWDEVRSLKDGPADLYTTQASTGLSNNGYGTITGGTASTDSDGDGMPDYWEAAMGLNAGSDEAMTLDGEGYANIENYINYLAEPHVQCEENNSCTYDLKEITGGWDNITPQYSIDESTHGSATLNNNVVTFQPEANFYGIASFKYTVKGSDSSSYQQTVRVCVVPNESYVTVYPTLNKCGGGSSKQTVAADSSISDFCYSWTNSKTVSISWEPYQPDGITTTYDNSAQTVTFSGTPLYGGTYNFTVTTETLNDSVCTKSGSIIVNGAYAMPQIIKRGGGSSNQSIILGNALADYNFGWTVVPTISIEWEPSAPEGIVINEDDANQTIYFSGTPTVAGTYTYTLTAANYDSVATRKGSITVSSDNTGLSREEAEQGGINLYPNPMQESATLKITTKGNYQIELIHTTGQVVWQKTAASDGNTPIIIERGNLKAGIYLLKISSSTDTQILKLIVK